MIRNLQTDKHLLTLIAQKDGQSLSVLYDRYYDSLCRMAFKRIPDETVVEEIVQDVFMVLWDKAAVLEADQSIERYLFAVLRNKVLYELRTKTSEAARASFYKIVDEVYNVNAADILEAKELEQKVNQVIEGLSPQSREAFKLSRFEQMSYKRIAEEMNVSVGTVEKHISKALSILRKEVGEFDSSYLIILFIYLLKAT